ncbi:MAG: hypothetical protein KJO82_01555 [Gammaproteobacteria bacterium]|nr:hypothetical protein [Gammaproteobacteria bacterium]
MNIWKPLSTALIAAFLLGLAGCNTTEGIGEDIEEIGEEIQDEADDHS